jgi:hypothetical protein
VGAARFEALLSGFAGGSCARSANRAASVVSTCSLMQCAVYRLSLESLLPGRSLCADVFSADVFQQRFQLINLVTGLCFDAQQDSTTTYAVSNDAQAI